jgi:glycosyltransferase involved in cell wall biosynthesis
MRFVFLTYHYTADIDNPTDWYHRIAPYVGSLEELAKKHEVIRVEQINYEGETVHEGVRYIFRDFGKKKNLFPRALHRFVQSLQADIVFVNGLHFPLQFIQLRRLLGPSTVLIWQHHAEQPFRGIKKIFQRLASHKADAILFASMDLGMTWIRKGNINDEKKLHEVMEVSSRFSPWEKAMQGKTGSPHPLYLWVGRLEKNKDPITVVEGFKKFLAICPGAKLQMIFQSDELLPEVKKISGEEQAIEMLGAVAHHGLENYYNNADFFISGSHYEGSGAAVCEAMSCGCIPILTNIDSFRAMRGNAGCGLLYKAGDSDSLLAELKRSLSLDIYVEKQKTLQQFREHLSFPAIAHKIQAIASVLLNKAP